MQSIHKWRRSRFVQREIIMKWRKYFDDLFKNLLPQNNWPISTKLGTKHSLVVGIQVCSNEGRHHFPRGNNYKKVKIHWQLNYSISTRLISTTLGTKHLWVVGIQVWSNEGPDLLARGTERYIGAKSSSELFWSKFCPLLSVIAVVVI